MSPYLNTVVLHLVLVHSDFWGTSPYSDLIQTHKCKNKADYQRNPLHSTPTKIHKLCKIQQNLQSMNDHNTVVVNVLFPYSLQSKGCNVTSLNTQLSSYSIESIISVSVVKVITQDMIIYSKGIMLHSGHSMVLHVTCIHFVQTINIYILFETKNNYIWSNMLGELKKLQISLPLVCCHVSRLKPLKNKQGDIFLDAISLDIQLLEP